MPLLLLFLVVKLTFETLQKERLAVTEKLVCSFVKDKGLQILFHLSTGWFSSFGKNKTCSTSSKNYGKAGSMAGGLFNIHALRKIAMMLKAPQVNPATTPASTMFLQG